jgi:hypothetical protein
MDVFGTDFPCQPKETPMSHPHRLALVIGAVFAFGANAWANEPPSQSDADKPVRSTHANNPRTGNEDPASKAQAERVSQLMSDDDSITNFEHADSDASGSISRAEFDALKHQSMTFADVDSDRNGVISHMEWDNHGQNTDDDK